MSSDNMLEQLDSPRKLHPYERTLIDQLLRPSFNGRDELRAQIERVQVNAEGSGDSRTLRFSFEGDVPRASVALRVPVEGEALDEDGVPIAVLLHVVDGLIDELEVYRVDGEPIRLIEVSVVRSVSVNQPG